MPNDVWDVHQIKRHTRGSQLRVWLPSEFMSTSQMHGLPAGRNK